MYSSDISVAQNLFYCYSTETSFITCKKHGTYMQQFENLILFIFFFRETVSRFILKFSWHRNSSFFETQNSKRIRVENSNSSSVLTFKNNTGKLVFSVLLCSLKHTC